jgi:hypothetical protein
VIGSKSCSQLLKSALFAGLVVLTASAVPASAFAAPAATTAGTPTPSVAAAGMPRVVGLSGRSAVLTLQRAGYKVVLGRPVHASVPARRIAAQGIRPGTVVRRGTTVRLESSLGPAPAVQWHTSQASFFGGAGEIQSVAGPYPNTGYMNAHGPYYFAHKSMRFGTKVAFNFRGRTLVAVCADRGPYSGNREFDLGANTAAKLGFDVGAIRWAYTR